MNFRTCQLCHADLVLTRADARFCSTRCRVYFSRGKRGIPDELISRPRWVRYSRSKVPLKIDGGNASSTNSSSWASFDEVSRSNVGVGMGFVLNGDGLGCYDLDHCFIDGAPSNEALSFIRSMNPFYVEVSPSGDGLHAWVFSERSDGFRRKVGGLNVEFYTHSRYLTVTGNSIRF